MEAESQAAANCLEQIYIIMYTVFDGAAVLPAPEKSRVEDVRQVKTLNEHMKTGQFKRSYLLYGEEAYLKKQYKEKLTKAMFPDGDTVNYAYFEGKGTEPSKLIDLAETMPFFAERRLIVVENSGFFKSSCPELADYIRQMPDTACFLFVEEEADKRGKMFKAVKETGYVLELKRQDEKTLLLWIARQVKGEQKQIKESTARYLLERVGTDMENLEKELEKLFGYTLGETEITVSDIDAICSVQIENKIFKMIEAAAAKRQKEMLDYYYDLLTLKEPPLKILSLLSRQFRLLLETKELVKEGRDRSQIAKVTKQPPFAAEKCIRQCREFSAAQLKGILSEAAELEEMAKTGRLDQQISVELFIVKNTTE